MIAQACEQQQIEREQLTVYADRGIAMTSKPVVLSPRGPRRPQDTHFLGRDMIRSSSLDDRDPRYKVSVKPGTAHTDLARRLAGEQLQPARAFARPRTLGITLRASGLTEGGETGLDLLAEAVKTLEESQSPFELVRALSNDGAALRRAGRRVQARAELERALDLAHRLGARRIANQARAELIAAGAKPRRDVITGRDAR